jgi:hypothetical protein
MPTETLTRLTCDLCEDQQLIEKSIKPNQVGWTTLTRLTTPKYIVCPKCTEDIIRNNPKRTKKKKK